MDERLWRGAYEQGWRVYIKGKRNDGHYWYVTPKGRRLGSKTEALSLGVQRKQPTSRPAQTTSPASATTASSIGEAPLARCSAASRARVK